jgi:hypothetical protein
MFKKIVVVAGVASVLGVVGMASPAGADEPSDWTLENCVDANGQETTKISDGAQCDLKNRKSGKCLVREGHVGQVDWDFAACSSKPRNMKVTAKSSGPVTCGETFALKLGSEYFRKCRDPQKIGINVCSEGTDTPETKHFEWQFQGCSGQVEAGKPVSLYNVARKDSVVFAKRPSRMVDTCWSDKMKLGQCTTARDK